MRTEILGEIGLTKSEINVYISLLELGSSSTGKIVDKSGASSSKIYEILDRLMHKGLVSYIIKANVKYFEAAPPKRIMDYMKEKEEKFKKQVKELNSMIPELELKRKLSKYKSEATIFKSAEGIRTAFRNLVDELNKGEEVHIMGVYDFGEEFLPLALFFQRIRSKKGIKAKFLMNSGAKNIATEFKKYPPVEIKYMPEDMLTPGIFLIYNDKVIVNLAKEKTFFVIQSKSAADTFESYFQMMWNQKTETYQGQEAVESVYKDIIEKAKPEDDVIVFAAKPVTKRASDYNLKWAKEISKRAKSLRFIYYGVNERNKKRAKEMEARGGKVKILPTQETLPISTVVAGDTIINSVWGKHPITFKIEDEIVADSYRTNFDIFWNQEARVVKGLDAVQNLFEDMLKDGSIDLIGARGYFVDLRPNYIDDWEKRAIKRGLKWRNIVDIETKGHRITRFPFAETKYTIPKEFSNLSVFWISGNKVAISNWTKKEPIVLIIENKSLHDMYKEQFELLWKKDKF